MENKKISVEPKKLEAIASAFGLLVRSIEKEMDGVIVHPLRKEGAILVSAVFMLSPKLSEQEWNAAMLNLMSVLKNREVNVGEEKPLSLPEWDPDDEESLSAYELCDALFVLLATNEAADSGDNSKDYYGPILTVAGYILDGAKNGYLAKTKDIMEIEGDYICRFYSALPQPEKGKEILKNQMDGLIALYQQFQSESAA